MKSEQQTLYTKHEFKQRVEEWAEKIGVRAHHITLRPMKNKWASCSTKGFLTFNIELLHVEKELGDYVIIHELVHLHVPNHGKLWKALMMAYAGDFVALEKRLQAKVKGERAAKK